VLAGDTRGMRLRGALLTPPGRSSLCTPKAERRVGEPPSEAHMPRLLPVLLLPTASLWLFAQAPPPKPAYDMSLPRAEKITLAKSAAPPEVSDKATV
jgi:hypothetical protein